MALHGQERLKADTSSRVTGKETASAIAGMQFLNGHP